LPVFFSGGSARPVARRRRPQVSAFAPAASLDTLEGVLLQNHGPLIVGRKLAEACMLMHLLERAAQAQLRAMAALGGALPDVGPALASLTQRQWLGDGSVWDGDVEWPAWLRRLDCLSPGFRQVFADDGGPPWPPGAAAHRNRRPRMPTIRVELFAGRTVEQKRALAQALTEAAVRTLGGSADAVDVLFHDIERHDWATGGALWSDKAAAPKPV